MSASNEILNMLEVVRGPGIERWALVKIAKISDNVTFSLNQGRVVHINASGEFETGGTGTQMPMYLWRPANALDVEKISSRYASMTTGAYRVYQAQPSGDTVAFVATGGFEFWSSEYDTAQTYAINELLTTTVANTTLATGGVLTNVGTSTSDKVRPFVDYVCGVVSGPEQANQHRTTMLPFYSYFLPQNVNP